MMGNASVRVESPFPNYAAPRVFNWMQSLRSRVCDDNSPTTLDAFMEDWHGRGATVRTWGVWRGSDLGGLVTVEPLDGGTANTHCIFKREFWGRHVTETALRLVYSEVFESGAEALQSLVFRDNRAIIALSRSLGAKPKALYYEATTRNGEPVDIYLLNLSKEAFYAVTSDGATGSRTDQRGRVDRGGADKPGQQKHVDAKHRPHHHADTAGEPAGGVQQLDGFRPVPGYERGADGSAVQAGG